MKKIYLVRASKWEHDARCACTTRDRAEFERARIASEYGLDAEDNIDECIQIIECNLLEDDMR